MHLPLIILTVSAAALASAQVVFNTTTFQFVCPSSPPNGAYCTGPSLTSNIIVRCTGTEGVAGNCNDNLAPVPPMGVKGFAPCYESSPTAADAACSYGGTVYPDNGPSFAIPGGNTTTNNNTPPTNNTKTTPSTATTTTTPPPIQNTTLPLNATSPTSSPPAPSALYPLPIPNPIPFHIPNATNATDPATATGTGTGTALAPSKTGAPFTGAAGRKSYLGAVVANVGAVMVAIGFVLLL